MVKKFKRNNDMSDLRPLSVLSECVEYLTNSPRLWGDESNLNRDAVYEFSMDRLRAVSVELSFHQSNTRSEDVGKILLLLMTIARFHVRALVMCIYLSFKPPVFDESLHLSATTNSLKAVVACSQEPSAERSEAASLLLLFSVRMTLRKCIQRASSMGEGGGEAKCMGASDSEVEIITADCFSSLDTADTTSLLRKYAREGAFASRSALSLAQSFLEDPPPDPPSPSPSSSKLLKPLCSRCVTRGIEPAPEAELCSAPCGCTVLCRPCGMKMATGGKCRMCNCFYAGVKSIISPSGPSPHPNRASSMDVKDVSDDEDEDDDGQVGDADGNDQHEDKEKGKEAGLSMEPSSSIEWVAEICLTALERRDPGSLLRVLYNLGHHSSDYHQWVGRQGRGRACDALAFNRACSLAHAAMVIWTMLPEVRLWRLFVADKSAQPGEKISESVLSRLLFVGTDHAGVTASIFDMIDGNVRVIDDDEGNDPPHILLKVRGSPFTWRATAEARRRLLCTDLMVHDRNNGISAVAHMIAEIVSI